MAGVAVPLVDVFMAEAKSTSWVLSEGRTGAVWPRQRVSISD